MANEKMSLNAKIESFKLEKKCKETGEIYEIIEQTSPDSEPVITVLNPELKRKVEDGTN